MLSVFTLVVLICSLYSSSAGRSIDPYFQVNTNDLNNDYAVTIVRKGNESEVRFQDGDRVTTYYFLAAQQYQIEKPDWNDDCYVRRAYQQSGFGLDCEYQQLMTSGEVTDEISEKCGNRQIYAVRPDECTDENRGWHGSVGGCIWYIFGFACGKISW